MSTTTTVTWDILNLNRRTKDGYVFEVDFSVNATDGTYEHEIKGTVQLPEPETLVPYKDLTKTIVLKWLQDRINAMNAEDQRNPSTAEIENTIKVQLEEQIRPTTDKGKPWS